MHKDFIDVAAAVPGILVEPRYATHDNFIGVPVDGYEAPKVVVSNPVAAALKGVQAELARKGMALKIFDGYRPQRAVDHFMRWINDPADTIKKAEYYPNVSKPDLLKLGYIAEKSGHSRGGSVDVTLVTGEGPHARALDMGSPWDLFDPVSHADAAGIGSKAFENRRLLADVMTRHDFKPFNEEWWHFTLEPEPFPDSYFDFPIE